MVALHRDFRKQASLLLSALTLFTFASHPLSAQNAETLKRFETEKHLGSVEETIVGIEITNHAANGTVEVMHANGFVLRCDGYILVPEGIFAGYMQNEQRAASHTCAFVLHPGTDHEQRIPFPPPITISDILYVAFKLSNVHEPALRTLLSSAVKPGDPIQVYFSRWDTARGHFAPVEHIATTLAANPKASSKPLIGERQFGAPMPNVPVGAVVVGSEGMGIGLVPGAESTTSTTRFLGFEKLYLATNCISAVAASDAQFDAMKEERDNAEMVAIPGGPMQSDRIPEPEMKGAPVACMAPFQIDKDQVTNARYLKFWKSLSPEQKKKHSLAYYPTGWAEGDTPFPDSLGDTPVLGVSFEGAQAFAAWAGKRLLTPCEWCLAALGPKGMANPPEWTKRYIEDRNKVVEEVGKAHRDYVLSHPFMDAADFLPYSMLPNGVDCDEDPQKVHYFDVVWSWTAPWIANADGETYFGRKDKTGYTPFLNFPESQVIIDPVKYNVNHPRAMLWFDAQINGDLPPRRTNPRALDVAAWSKETVQRLTDPLFERWKDPGYVLPIGSRDYDVSPYGVRDMLMNANEIIIGAPSLLKGIPENKDHAATIRLSWQPRGYTSENAGTANLSAEMSRADRQGRFLYGSGLDPAISMRPGAAGYPAISLRSGEHINTYEDRAVGLHNIGLDGPYQTIIPISRLVARTSDWPPSELILAQSNLSEVTSMLTALQSVGLAEDRYGSQRPDIRPLDWLGTRPPYTVTVTNGNTGASITWIHPFPNGSNYGSPIGMKMWVEQPRHPHQEIGRPTPSLADTGPLKNLAGTLYFVPPVGFRCAR